MSGVSLRAGGRPARLLMALARIQRAGIGMTPDLVSVQLSRLWDLDLVSQGTTTLTPAGQVAARVLEAGS